LVIFLQNNIKKGINNALIKQKMLKQKTCLEMIQKINSRSIYATDSKWPKTSGALAPDPING